MGSKKLRSGEISVEIRVLNPDRVLNILWNNEIRVSNIKKIDIVRGS